MGEAADVPLIDRFLPGPEDTDALARQCAIGFPATGVVTLSGSLGAGKTAFARAFLRARGVTGAIRSPTYTLVEPYETNRGLVLHMDLYRLEDPGELHALALDDTPPERALWLVEWPSRAAGWLPSPVRRVELHAEGAGRRIVVRGPAIGLLQVPDAH